MTDKRYIMAFTTGSLFQRESLELAGLYLEEGDWQKVREKVLKQNLLQARTQATLKRVFREISSRLSTLSLEEMEFLIRADSKDQCYLLWIAVCRRYKFIADFAVEVIRERYLSLKADLHHEDFDSFFHRKTDWHPELDEISPATVKKLRQVLFKILKGANLLNADKSINPAMLSPELYRLIIHNNQNELSYFPVFESDLEEMII